MRRVNASTNRTPGCSLAKPAPFHLRSGTRSEGSDRGEGALISKRCFAPYDNWRRRELCSAWRDL